MAAAVAAAPDKFATTTAHGVLGADAAVDAVLKYAECLCGNEKQEGEKQGAGNVGNRHAVAGV